MILLFVNKWFHKPASKTLIMVFSFTSKQARVMRNSPQIPVRNVSYFLTLK